ncbi:LytTR family transcriptional regulator DNA-binding domain-containing protein [Paenibacillus arenosi]|uniref:LytTR family transcriptional regulator DNA-binding domain-containing protein n=1 Tax=Paenibacillus arenosi TaxID=2774142 RepID=A0ABR9B272_9BACL|nr:LytTR family transcriptional regulator DNA-binding domain-containing protein [Paenibacillus arenosi]
MIRAFVVDDEPLARDELMYLLRRTKRVDIVGEAESYEEAMDGIQETTPDVIFLDIQLTDATGIEIAERLKEDGCQSAIVFATAYDEYALKAFELNAADYILKPYEEARVQQTVEKLIQRLAVVPTSQPIAVSGAVNSNAAKAVERTERLAVTVDERIAVLHVDRIIYIESEEGKAVVVTEGQRYKVCEALTVLERKLNHPSMLRVHRSYLVNVDYVKEIEPWFNSTYVMKMKDGASIPVSRTYVKDLKQKLGL